jgi:hypothetical protein
LPSSSVRDARLKVGLLRQMRCKDAGSMVRGILEQRESDMRQGEKTGLIPVMKQCAERMGVGHLWNRKGEEWGSKETFGDSMKVTSVAVEEKAYEKWATAHGPRNNNLHMTKPKWGEEEYLRWQPSDAKGRVLKFAVRIGSASFRGGKVGVEYAESKKGQEEGADTKCRFGCGAGLEKQQRSDETAYHCVFICAGLQEERRPLIKAADQGQGGQLWRRRAATSEDKASTLAVVLSGAEMDLGTRKQLDRALRKFLRQMDAKLGSMKEKSLLDDPWGATFQRQPWEEEQDWIALEEAAEWAERERKSGGL